MAVAGSRRKRFTPEQIMAKLREAETLQAQGYIPQLYKRLGITDQTFYRWRLAAADHDRRRPRFAIGAFLAGHAFTWAAFGVLAYLADVATHTHPALVLTGVLVIAGAYQFSALKQTCLAHRQHFDANLTAETGRRVRAVFWLGRNHGLACVGCCGPLMLLMLTLREAPPLWMAALTVVMLCETAPGLARWATPMVGVALLSAASLILAHSSLALQTLS
jgi:predicted metal-binding membrane protein